MTLFYKNLKYLLKQTGIKQKYFCNSISVSVSSIWKWSQDTIPDLPQLKKIAEFFSTRLNIIIKAEDLLEKNIETLVQNLPNNPSGIVTEEGKGDAGKTSIIENRPNDLKQAEIDFLFALRKLYNNSSEPLPAPVLVRLIDFLDIVGIDSEIQQRLIDMIKAFGKWSQNGSAS